MEANFVFERETKRTYRFQEEPGQGDPKIGTLYVQKSAFEARPRRIKVQVEVLE